MSTNNITHRLATAVVLVLFLSLVTWGGSGVQVAYASDCPFEGSGWQDSPYIIDSPSDLVWLQQNFGSSYNGRYFLQTVDLDMTGIAFNPIGNGDFASGNRFGGTYDGGGRTIHNLSITSSAAYVGLFGYLEGGHIKSLTLQDVTIRGTAAGASVGAFAGDANSVSGISLEDCGVVGTSLVEGPASGAPNIGGLVGRSANNFIANCYFSGTVRANTSSSSVGGIAGYSGHSAAYSIQKCYFSGTIAGSLGANTGGIVGNNLGSLSGNYFLDTAGVSYGSGSTASNSGATPISSAVMMTSTTFTSAGWDLNGMWHIAEGDSYPLHRSAAPRVVDIKVVFTETASDNIVISNASPGYIVRVYDSAAGGSLLGSAVASGNSVTVDVGKLPVTGSVYASMQTTTRVEGARTGKAYAKLGLPIVEGFEAGSLPTGWVSDSVAGGLAWSVIDAAESVDPTCSAHDGTYIAKANCYDDEGQSRLRMDSSISLPDGLTYTLVFWMYHDVGVSDWVATYGEDQLQAQVSVDDGTSWMPLGVPIVRVAEIDGWERYEYSLDSYIDSNVMVGFLATSGYWNNMYIDDVEISGSLTSAPALTNGLSFFDAVGPANNGCTVIILGDPSVPGNTFRYLISSDNHPVEATLIGADVSGWTAVTNGQLIAVTHGKHIGVVEADASGGVVQFSDATAVVIDEYSLTYTAGEHGSIEGTTSQVVPAGSDGTEVIAVSDPGHHFVNWSDGITTAARTDRGVNGLVSVTANFAPNIAITVVADSQSKVYGNDDPSFTYQVTDGALEGGDSFSGSLDRMAGEDVDNYQISQGTLTAGPKYDITFLPANLSITRRSLQVTADSQEKTYGAADPTLTHQVTEGSLVSGDQFTGSLARLPGEDVDEY